MEPLHMMCRTFPEIRQGQTSSQTEVFQAGTMTEGMRDSHVRRNCPSLRSGFDKQCTIFRTSAQSLFSDVMVCFAFDGTLDGGRLNKGIRFLLIGSNTGVVRSITRSVMYLSYWSWPVFSITRTVWTIAGSATPRLSRTRRSSLSSMNGFPISSTT